MSYNRVIPRDFFNEAKLLKCMGLLALKILDNQTPCKMQFDESGEPFIINQCIDGGLFVANYPLLIKDEVRLLHTNYNSKSNYPLICIFEDEEVEVFTDEGEFSQEFIEATEQN